MQCVEGLGCSADLRIPSKRRCACKRADGSETTACGAAPKSSPWPSATKASKVSARSALSRRCRQHRNSSLKAQWPHGSSRRRLFASDTSVPKTFQAKLWPQALQWAQTRSRICAPAPPKGPVTPSTSKPPSTWHRTPRSAARPTPPSLSKESDDLAYEVASCAGPAPAVAACVVRGGSRKAGVTPCASGAAAPAATGGCSTTSVVAASAATEPANPMSGAARATPSSSGSSSLARPNGAKPAPPAPPPRPAASGSSLHEGRKGFGACCAAGMSSDRMPRRASVRSTTSRHHVGTRETLAAWARAGKPGPWHSTSRNFNQ
mmetsp:Transcript_52513/g.170584  ORF Transcript_52513/g.170584 Transcript_52513/m.170584 type:complete len:320 (+) Transcript_52513:189-1148(+)